MKKNIALVAHDACKERLVSWLKKNKKVFINHHLCATGTTGSLIEKALEYPVRKFNSGPLGGDQQIGSRITEGEIDALIFFWDPLSAQPHDADVKALLRLATLMNIPVACNEATGDLLAMSYLNSPHVVPQLVTNHNNVVYLHAAS